MRSTGLGYPDFGSQRDASTENQGQRDRVGWIPAVNGTEFRISTWILDGCVWTHGKAENRVGRQAEQSVHTVLCLLATN